MNEDLNNLFEKFNINPNNISSDMLNNLSSILNNSDSSEEKQNTSASSNIDFETIMKMKSIVEQMNSKDDPRASLLRSLKPYLNDSRKSKVEQYIQLLNVSKIMPLINGDKNHE